MRYPLRWGVHQTARAAAAVKSAAVTCGATSASPTRMIACSAASWQSALRSAPDFPSRGQAVQIDAEQRHGLGVELEQPQPGGVARQSDLDGLRKQPATQHCRVQLIWTVRRRDDEDASRRGDSVHLREQLVDEPVARGEVPTFGGKSVDLVDEDDGRGVFPRFGRRAA